MQRGPRGRAGTRALPVRPSRSIRPPARPEACPPPGRRPSRETRSRRDSDSAAWRPCCAALQSDSRPTPLPPSTSPGSCAQLRGAPQVVAHRADLAGRIDRQRPLLSCPGIGREARTDAVRGLVREIHWRHPVVDRCDQTRTWRPRPTNGWSIRTRSYRRRKLFERLILEVLQRARIPFHRHPSVPRPNRPEIASSGSRARG